MIDTNLIALMLISLVVLPLMTSELLRLLGNYTTDNLVKNFGMNSQVAIGGLGVIVHELSHLIVAVIFCHKIIQVKLLEPKAYQYTGTLGYVEHRWNKSNLYESLGNFFIGLAPCFLSSECLWIIHGFLFHNNTLTYGSTNNFSSAFQVALTNIMHPFGAISWQLLVYLILIVMIASTGYGLSNADMKGSLSGLPYWLGFLVIIYLLIMITNTPEILTGLFWKITVLWLTFLGRGLIYLLTSLVIINGLKMLNINKTFN